MTVEEFKLEQNTGYIAPVTADSSAAQVEEAKRMALAKQTTTKEDIAGLDGTRAPGNAEADLILDIGLEALGVKSAATAAQLVGGRMADTMETRNAARSTIEEEVQKASRAPGSYQPSFAEDLLARANIVTSSLDLDPKHVNTDMWEGKETKMPAVSMARSLTISQDIANRQALDNVYAVERQHSAMLGHVNQMVPGLGLGSGPSINPRQLLADAERMSDMEDWQRRLAEQASA